MMLNFCVICASVPCYCHISCSYFVGFHVVHLFRKTVHTVLSFHVAMHSAAEGNSGPDNMHIICQEYVNII